MVGNNFSAEFTTSVKYNDFFVGSGNVTTTDTLLYTLPQIKKQTKQKV